MLGLSSALPIPNFESRKNNVYFHDVHHLISNNGTNWKGESAVAAWEIASGGWGKFYIPWLLTLWAMGLGAVFYTQSTIDSFRKGLIMKNVISGGLSKQQIDELTVEELRLRLMNNNLKGNNLSFWVFLSVFTFVLPFAMGLLFLISILNYWH